MPATLSDLLVTAKAIQLEKLSLADMQNIRTVSKHIDCRWQVFSS